LTTFTVNCFVSSMLIRVSFFFPFLSLTGAKHTVIGFAQMPVKNENGARLGTPSGETVETQAMGRGRIVAIISR